MTMDDELARLREELAVARNDLRKSDELVVQLQQAYASVVLSASQIQAKAWEEGFTRAAKWLDGFSMEPADFNPYAKGD
jgi:hypothetical protein